MDLHTPMTDVQKGLYYIQNIANDTSAYNITFACELVNDVNIVSLRNTIDNIALQHPEMNANLTRTDDDNVSIIYGKEKPPLDTLDISDLSSEEAYEKAYGLSQQPFDLHHDRLVRFFLLKRPDKHSIFIISAHHIAFDFWSLSLLLDRIRRQYALRETTPQMETTYAAPFTFHDFASSQQQAKQTKRYRDSVDSICKRLPASIEPLDMKTDFPRPAVNSYTGKSLYFTIPAAITERLSESAKRNNVTLYVYLLTAYQLLLNKYSGQDQVLVGSPVAGREKRKYANTIGNFVNTIILPLNVDQNSSFQFLLGQSKENVANALRHQHIPFPAIVEALKIERDPSRTPLVQASFSWDKLPQLASLSNFFVPDGDDETIDWGDLKIKPYYLPQQQGQFDISLEMGAETNGELIGTIKYRDDLFYESTIRRFSDNFIQLLSQVSKHIDSPVSELDFLSKSETERLHRLAQSIRTITVENTDFIHCIEYNAKVNPQKTALVSGARTTTYGELDRISNQYAHFLTQTLGIEQGSRVGICLPRNENVLFCLVALAKIGASYIPMDPDHPQQRLQLIAKNADLDLLIKAEGHTWQSSTPTINIEIIVESSQHYCPYYRLKFLRADQPIYTIFTSGSTGVPKGVTISRRALTNLLVGMAVELQFSDSDRLLAITTVAFDIATLELFLPLVCGGSVIIASKTESMDPKCLMELIDRYKPSYMQATPATWKMMVAADWSGSPDLSILCGGEALPMALAEKLVDKCRHLWNVYGPTETTIWSTMELIDRSQPGVSIGRPIANTQVYIVDQNMNLQPIGVVGELCIGGAGQAIGYYNQPELTRRAFVDNPFGKGTLYKTGDLAYMDEQGKLYCVGRSGNQVKIRGFRVELEDVEENLRAIPGVLDAAVTLKELNNEQYLVCYYVGSSNCTIDDLTIRQTMLSKVPAYMVPGIYVSLPALPKNTNGKIDRKQLPTPVIQLADSSQNIAPRDDVEIQVHQIWKSILETEEISVNSDFYHIGGHSLLAVQVITKINEVFNIELPASTMLQNTTIEQLASIIKKGPVDRPEKSLVVLNASGSESPLFLMHPIGGTVFCYLTLSRYIDKSIPVYAFQSPGIENSEMAEVGIEEIAASYVQEILVQQPDGPYRLGGWCFGGVIAYEVARQLANLGKEVQKIIVFDTRAPIEENHPQDGDDATLLSWFARDLAVPYNKTLTIAPEELRQLDSDEMFTYVLDKARKINVLPSDSDDEKLRNYFEVYIANGIALQLYQAEKYNGDLVLYRAKDEKEDYGPVLGWESLSGTNLTVKDIPGDHNSIMYAPNVEILAEELNKDLLQVTTEYQFQEEISA